jgi:ATP-dependent helicase/nuclease subunit A
VLYVALTRPKDRLYIISQQTKKPSTNGSASDYLMNYCAANEGGKVADHHYRYGSFGENAQQHEEANNDIEFETVAYNSWREKIQVSYQAPLVWDVENPETIGEHGTLIHNILSQVNVIDDVTSALEVAVRKGLITEVEKPEIKKEIDSVFKIEGVADLFTDFDELKNERSILLPNENGKTKQPDRVVVKNGTTYLIDYKSGKPKGEDELQVKNYEKLLMQLGYQNIRSYLLYIKSGELVGV